VDDVVRIGILGDFDPDSPTLPAVSKSLEHSATSLHTTVEATWIPTSSPLEPKGIANLEKFDGIWAAPGSPYQSMDGMLRGLQFARERNWPFLGTCGGFQYALIEIARNVIGIEDADTAENHSGSKNVIIHPVACAIPNRDPGAPKLSGTIPEIRLRPGSYLRGFYGQDAVTEEFFCNFEVNPEYEWAIAEAGFPIVARGLEGEVRAIESPAHRFFIATLFQPQLSSRPEKPHPLVTAFVQAATQWAEDKRDDYLL
jgi:CTP synthase (UTP-ammonia lyase)